MSARVHDRAEGRDLPRATGSTDRDRQKGTAPRRTMMGSDVQTHSGLASSTAIGAAEEVQRIAAVMAADDHAVRAVGAEVTTVSQGRALVEMVLQRHHTNGHGLGHGGLIFFLADTAMAYASIRPGGAAGVTTAADVVFSQPAPSGPDWSPRAGAYTGRAGARCTTSGSPMARALSSRWSVARWSTVWLRPEPRAHALTTKVAPTRSRRHSVRVVPRSLRSGAGRCRR